MLLLAIYQSVFAETHVYNATCEGSYMKEGLLSDDLSVKKGFQLNAMMFQYLCLKMETIRFNC